MVIFRFLCGYEGPISRGGPLEDFFCCHLDMLRFFPCSAFDMCDRGARRRAGPVLVTRLDGQDFWVPSLFPT